MMAEGHIVNELNEVENRDYELLLPHNICDKIDENENSRIFVKYDAGCALENIKSEFIKIQHAIDIDMNITEDGFYIINDPRWFRNIGNFLSQPCTVVFKNIESIPISENISINCRIRIFSNIKIKIFIGPNKSITINGNEADLLLNNISISNCIREYSHLFILKNSTLTIKNGILGGNYTKKSLIHVEKGGNLTLENVEFNGNQLYYKLYLYGYSSPPPSCILLDTGATSIIKNCKFINHSSEQNPYSSKLIRASGSLEIYNSLFEKNMTNLFEVSNITLKGSDNSILVSNTRFIDCSSLYLEKTIAIFRGCEFYNELGHTSLNRNFIMITKAKEILLQNCKFNFNKRGLHDYSGAVYFKSNSNALCRISECTFRENQNRGDQGYGYGAAITFINTPCNIEESEFIENVSRFGGAIYIQNSQITCTGCLFEQNRAIDKGGAIYCYNGTLIESNNNFTNNNPDNFPVIYGTISITH